MADKKKLVDRLDQLAIRPPSPPLTTSPTPSEKEHLLSNVNLDIILTELHNRSRGQLQQESDWWSVHLSPNEYDNLLALIQAKDLLEGVRYDYFPQLSKFVLRMAGDIHEFVIEAVKMEIYSQLLLIHQGDNQAATDFAKKVRSLGSPENKLGVQAIHSPDGSFGHEDASDPGLIIEVSHSQKRKDLPFLADDYILGSNGIIQVVIGIDLEYQNKKGMEAKVIVWRPRFIEGDNGDIELEASQKFEGIFRAEDGSLVNGDQVLYIQLKDFGNKFECLGIDDIIGEITITFSQLYDIVQRAEERKQTTSQKRARSEVNIPEDRKRGRVRSPPEELRPEDEEQFRATEDKEEQRRSDQDSDYTPE